MKANNGEHDRAGRMRRLALGAGLAAALAAGGALAHPQGGMGGMGMMGGGMMPMMGGMGGGMMPMMGGMGGGMMPMMGRGGPMGGGMGMMGMMPMMMRGGMMPMMGGMGMMGGGMMPMMMGRQGMMLGMLDLSDEQRARIRTIQRETASKVRRLWVQMADEADRLRDLYAADRPDPKAIGRAYSKIFDLKRQIIEARVAARNRMTDVLTPEQRKALKSMRERMRRGRMGMMGMGMMGSGGDAAGGPMSGKEHRRMMREGDHRRMMEQQ